jgi:hypothetical protein
VSKRLQFDFVVVLMSLYTPGGLSWALDPSFCARMLPQFPEGAKSSWVGYNFVTCNDIRVALAQPAGYTSAQVWLKCGSSAPSWGVPGGYMCGSTPPVGVRIAKPRSLVGDSSCASSY